MTYARQIIEYLAQSPGETLCDDCLAIKVGMKARQQARSRCILLAAEGKVIRAESLVCSHCGRTKIGNRISDPTSVPDLKSVVNQQRGTRPRASRLGDAPSKPWFWEGHVQSVIVGWLEGNGWNVTQHADTAAKTPGKDIVASKGDRFIWVTVKGFPIGTIRTSRSTQAGHWFARAVFDLIKYRTENNRVELAIGIPDCAITYRRLVEKSAWALHNLPARVIWVNEFGKVESQAFE